jgi:hypothetical protein
LNAVEYLQSGARRGCAEVVDAIRAHRGALAGATS